MENKTHVNSPDKNNKTLTRGTYLLTIRRVRFDRNEALEFKTYFEMLAQFGSEVLVVDGSPTDVFAAYDEIWRNSCQHETVDPQYKFLNGKVNGIYTGVTLASHDSIILADDDIRYTPEDVERMIGLLEEYKMVRPQNYFDPLPVWARMEAARMLLNRAWIKEGDYSGTLGVRASTMQRIGHYDGDVLFDNEEIVRHFRLHKAKIKYARDFFILKRPSTFKKWLEQRPRQAYEDFVMRLKTLFFVALPVDLIASYFLGGWQMSLVFVSTIAIGSIVMAALGLGEGAAKFFPPQIVLYAPLWVIERSFSTYWAIYWWLVYGGYPFGDKILSKGTGDAWTVGARTPMESENEIS